MQEYTSWMPVFRSDKFHTSRMCNTQVTIDAVKIWLSGDFVLIYFDFIFRPNYRLSIIYWGCCMDLTKKSDMKKEVQGMEKL